MMKRTFCPFCGEEVTKDKQGNLFCCYCNKTFVVNETLLPTEQQDENKAEKEKRQEEKTSTPENTKDEDDAGSNARTLGCLTFLLLVVIAVIFPIVMVAKVYSNDQSSSQNAANNASSSNYSSGSNFLTGRTNLTTGNIGTYCNIDGTLESGGYDVNWATIGRTQIQYTITVNGYSSLYSYHNASVTIEMELSYSVTDGNLLKSVSTPKTKKVKKTVSLTVGGDGSVSDVIDLGGICDSEITAHYVVTSVTGYVKKQ